MIIKDKELLRQVSEPCSLEQARPLLEQLKSELGEHGYGLSAPQIGVFKRVCYCHWKDPEGQPEELNLVNPVIREELDPFVFHGEGCLSFPGEFRHTNRFKQITIKDDYNNRDIVLIGIQAVVASHEINHLDGILFFDKMADLTIRAGNKIGRNDLCPCNSGKKFKRCCLK